MKDYNIMIDGRNSFDQLVNNDVTAYDNIWKITTSNGDNYTTDCPLAYTCFKVHHKLMAIDPIKKQALNSDPKTMQEINFVGNL